MSRPLYITAASTLLNPTLDTEAIAAAVAEDAEGAASEWLGTFRSDIAEYLPDAVLDAAVVAGRYQLNARLGVVYSAFCDPSGGTGSDAMTLAIGHAESGRLVLDLLVARKAPFDPELVVGEFAELLAGYGLAQCVGDRYGAAWVTSSFQRHGVAYEASEIDKSAIFVEAAKPLVEGRVELLDDPVLLTELRTLERRPRSGGRQDLIDHARGAHDDRANAAAGCVWLLAQREQREAVVPEELALAAVARREPDIRYAPRVIGAVVDGGRLVLCRRMGLVALPVLTESGPPEVLAGRISYTARDWSVQSILLADGPGGKVGGMLRSLGFEVRDVRLFDVAIREGFRDLRAELAFGLRTWLGRAKVDQSLLHALVGLGYRTRRGAHELADAALGAGDALAITLLDHSTYQDPRTVSDMARVACPRTDYDPLERDAERERRREQRDDRPSWMKPTIFLDR